MRNSVIFLSTVVFMISVIGGTTFLNSLYSGHGVSSNSTIQVDEEYDEVQKDIGVGDYEDNEQSLYYKIENPNEYSGVDAVDQAVAGILVVPKFIGILTTPIEIVNSVISGLQQSPVDRYVPGFVWVGVQLLFYGTLLYSVLSLIIGIKT